MGTCMFQTSASKSPVFFIIPECVTLKKKVILKYQLPVNYYLLQAHLEKKFELFRKPKDNNRNTNFLNYFSQCSPQQNHLVYGYWPELSTFFSNIPSVFNCQSCRFPTCHPVPCHAFKALNQRNSGYVEGPLPILSTEEECKYFFPVEIKLGFYRPTQGIQCLC